MAEWGNNPATWAAIASAISACGIIALAFSAYFAWKTFRETRQHRSAVEDELSVRLRPWIGCFDVDFVPSGKGNREEVLHLHWKNVGALPAQNAKLQLEACPMVLKDKEPDNSIQRPERGGKTLFPDEDIDYWIQLHRYQQFGEWRSERRDVRVTGTLQYSMYDSNFETDFQVTILFSQSEPDNDDDVPIRWRNLTAS